MMKFFKIILLLVLFVQTATAIAKPTELVFWHSMAGQLGAEVNRLSQGFNQSQTDFIIKPVYKGDYLESLTSFAAAFSAGKAPALVQVFEVGKPTMLSPKGIIKPVDEIMSEQGIALPKASFLPVVRDYYSENGQLMAMPFNISLPILFYNADALATIGVTSKSFPSTWDELERVAQKLNQAGFDCAYTSAYPAWIFIESYSAIHGLPLIEGSEARYNNSALIHHLERLKRWQSLHYFEYGGRTDDATARFTSGRCPLFSQSSGTYNSLAELVPFRLGVALLPMDTKVRATRLNNVAGGAAIWVRAGLEPEAYRGVAKFLLYLSEVKIQKTWYQNTGYLPIGLEGIYEPITHSAHPTLALAKVDLAQSTIKPPAGMQNQIRHINEGAIESIFAGIQSPKEALDDAVSRANYALLRFKRNTQ